MHSLIHPQNYPFSYSDGPLNSWIFEDILTNPLAQNLTAIVLLFLQAIVITSLVNYNKMERLAGSLPGLVYVLIMSAFPAFLGLNPLILGNTFILIAIFCIFKTYKRPKSTIEIFNAGLFSALATLFYIPFVIVSIAIFIGFIMIRSFSFKEKLQFLAGYFCPFYILATCLFAFSDLFVLKEYFLVNITAIQNPKLEVLQNYMYLATFGIMILLVLLNYRNYVIKKGIDVRKKIEVLYLLIPFGVISFLVWKNLGIWYLQILAVPLAILLGISLGQLRNKFAAELIHLIIFTLILMSHFGLDIL